MLEGKKVLAVQCSDTEQEQYAVYCDDQGLYLGSNDEGFTLLAILDNVASLTRPVKMYYHFPYICVTERYGLNAATVKITDGSVRQFGRKDYHSDVSSYSTAFVERDGHVLLIHQTQWNRLDVTDLETGELLTEREIYIRDSGRKDERGSPIYERKNYLDYFHSLLHVSPDKRHFASNGWMWHPVDNVICFDMERFLTEYETCRQPIEYYGGYAWDRPCTFVGDDTLVVAADKTGLGFEDGVVVAGKEPPRYHQLLFYDLAEVAVQEYTHSGYETDDTLPLAYSGSADCDVFDLDEYGEVEGGELHYEPETNSLVAISGRGAFEMTLDGEILHNDPEVRLATSNWALRFDDARAIEPAIWLQNWQYDLVRHVFYRFNENRVETRSIRQPGVPPV